MLEQIRYGYVVLQFRLENIPCGYVLQYIIKIQHGYVILRFMLKKKHGELFILHEISLVTRALNSRTYIQFMKHQTRADLQQNLIIKVTSKNNITNTKVLKHLGCINAPFMYQLTPDYNDINRTHILTLV